MSVDFLVQALIGWGIADLVVAAYHANCGNRHKSINRFSRGLACIIMGGLWYLYAFIVGA